MFATGYGEQAQLPGELRDKIVLQKPYTMTGMSRGLMELLEGEAEN
jgi:hypothetical protein